jgi:hypothetical protein
VVALVGWIEQPKYKKGLDPLGVQQPCIAVYSALLPGITNVTNRIAYYGFGPWFSWSFAQRYPEAKPSEFIEMLRRAEVLLALIGARHALKTPDDFPDQHDGALVGIDTLQSVVSQGANKLIRLSYYATLEDVPQRYFKNRRGGLGQYYLGVLRDEYRLLGDHKNGVIDFTIERGKPMAEAVAAGVDSDRFFRSIEADKVSLADLDSLSCFCPCQLRTKTRQAERALLLDTVVGQRPDLSESPEIRLRSIGLIIDFFRAADGCEFCFSPDTDFLVACYSRVLPNGQPWLPAPSHVATANVWAFYWRGELLSLAMQRLFREALLQIDSHGARLQSVEAAGQWCTSIEPFSEIIRQKPKTYDDLLANTKAKLPSLADIGNARHEVHLREKVTDVSGDALPAVDAAIQLIFTLLVRTQPALLNFEKVLGMNQIRLENYPINLDSIASRARMRWHAMTLKDCMADVLCWILATHRQVALRKLAQSGDDTRRLRMGEEALYVYGDTVDVARTAPRLRSTLRFLHDLGLTRPTKQSHLPVPTQDGLRILQQSHAS